MRNKSILFTLFATAVALCTIMVSCSKEKKEEPATLTIAPKTLSFESTEGSSVAAVYSTPAEYSFAVEEAAKSWCSASANETKLTVTVKANESTDPRTATIEITCKDKKEVLTVQQSGVAKVLEVSTHSIDKISNKGETKEFKVTTNVKIETKIKYSKEGENWIELVAPDPIAFNSENTFSIKVAANTETVANRTAKIEIKEKDGELLQEITVTQLGKDMEKIFVDHTQIEAVADKEAGISGAAYHMVDGDLNSLWHSPWANGEKYRSDYFPMKIEFYFRNPEDLNGLIYHPRPTSSGYNGNLKVVEIFVETQTEPLKKLMDFDFKASAEPTTVNLTDSPEKLIKGVKMIRFIIHSGYSQEPDVPGYASCAEMEFFKYKL